MDERDEILIGKKIEKGEIVSTYGQGRYGVNGAMQEECEYITTYHYSDWYQVYPDGSVVFLDSYLESVSVEEYCDYSFLPELDTGGGGGGSGTYGSEGGEEYEDCNGPKCAYTIDNGSPYITDGPENPIEDIEEYLECFDSNQSATVTVHVDQPVPGQSDPYAPNGPFDKDVGHVFLSITQGGVTRVVGFYPEYFAFPGNPQDQSILGDDSNRDYNVSITTSVTSTQLQTILNEITSFTQTYHLNDYNCTNFAVDIFDNTGVNLPQTDGTWPGGGGLNPGNLGVDIANMTSSSDYIVDLTQNSQVNNEGACGN